MMAEFFLSFMVTVGVNTGLANDWYNLTKKMLQKDEN